MTTDNRIKVTITERGEGRVVLVTLDNAGKLNVLNSAIMTEFVTAMAELSRDDRLRAVVLTGAGDRAFVGGADVDEMAGLRDPASARAFIRRVSACCAAVRDCPVPVIARLNGWTLGAGLELAAACDMRIAVADAQFGMPEVRLGIPSVVEAALLPKLVGWGRTREMLLFGDTFGADTALRFGLVEEVTERAGLDGAIERRLTSLLANGPRAVRLQKALIRQWEDLSLRDAIDAGVTAFGEAYAGDEPAFAMSRWRDERRARKTNPDR